MFAPYQSRWPSLPSVKHPKDVLQRCRMRLTRDPVTHDVFRSSGLAMNHQHPWFHHGLFSRLEPLVRRPTSRTEIDSHWCSWLSLTWSMLHLSPDTDNHSLWTASIIAFRLAWIINDELDMLHAQQQK